VPANRSPRRFRAVRALIALAAAPVAVGLSAALPTTAVPSAHAAGCNDIEVVWARGTTEDPGVGRVGNAFVQALRGKVGGRSVGAYGVIYPASYDFLQATAGANDASWHIQWVMDNCPATRIVLGGYSQGAAVVDALAAVPVPGLGFDAPLPGNAPEHIAGLVTFGNPAGKFGMSLANSPVWAGRAIDLCNAGDPVCNLGIFDATDVEAHRAYAGGPAYQAAGFIAGLL